MPIRVGSDLGTSLGKWLSVSLIVGATGIAAASCGGSAPASLFTDGGRGGDSGEITDAT